MMDPSTVGHMNPHRFTEYRKDGFPLCPKCGEDELVSALMMVWNGSGPRPTVQDCLRNGFHCLNCEFIEDD